MKRVLSIALALIIAFSGLTPIYADTSSSQLYNEAGNILKDLKLLTGNSSGDLMLEGNLSRQDMVIMITRLYKEEDNAKNYVVKPGENKFKDLTVARKNYIPYIAWAVNKNLIYGVATDKFGFGQDVTIQEYQAVLLRALGYNLSADEWKYVPEVASKYGIMKDLSSLKAESKITRGQMAVMTINALRQEMNGRNITLAEELGVTIAEAFSVEATVKVENNSLIFEGQAKGTNYLLLRLKPMSSTITSGENVIQIPTDAEGNFSRKVENLQVGNYHYRFESDNKYTDYKEVAIKVLPFNIADVKGNNLKEVTLTFTQAVDKATASIIGNYNTTAGSIKSIRFEENDTKVILTLTGNMTQRRMYKITATKIKSASGEETNLKDYEFEALDIAIPTVVSVKQLGTKALKVYLSEPVKNAVVNNFKIDGKNFSGNAKLENNIVTLTYYSPSYALSEGSHTITVSNIEDFAGNKATGESTSFDIIKDTTPPEIVSATATLEEVIIEFDEEIDPISARTNYFYWKNGSVKRYPNKVTFDGNKAIVEFTNNKLSTSQNTIYVENVLDYSNNKMKLADIQVLPTIDTSNPEVINYLVSDDGKTITINFSKNVVGNVRSNYSITDQNNKLVSIKDITGSGKEYKLNLYSALPVGVNTLTVKNIQDTTPYKNPLIEFTTTIEMKDIEKPKLVNHTGYGSNIILYFSKQMDMVTVSNPDNYVMTYGSVQYKLPDNTIFTPSSDGKAITMQLPEYFDYDGKRIMIGTSGNLTSLGIIGLKDLSGNDTDPLIINVKFDSSSSGKAKAIDYYKEKPGRQGVLLESNLIKLRFSIPIIQASPSDFAISGRTIYDVVADGSDEVTIYLNDSDMTYLPNKSITILPNNNMRTSIDTGVESGNILLFDELPPRVKDGSDNLAVNANQIELPFSEVLEEAGVSLYVRDLEVVRLSDGKILSKDEYTTSLKYQDKSILVITINRRDIASSYSVMLSGESNGYVTYIRDTDGNLAVSDSAMYFTERDIPKQ
ncbi:hypothetical protein [Tissierella sp.]|uniref:hypothetical protein n=1 Tax=Tissierella sp. TaxID=41274 RepID=UPI00285E9BFA|nr:hypothetical protein [Tissierella sp.]MDR7856982.1 hypothetical protein [Tissierella sp.]